MWLTSMQIRVDAATKAHKGEAVVKSLLEEESPAALSLKDRKRIGNQPIGNKARHEKNHND